jgi:hypothetical protein
MRLLPPSTNGAYRGARASAWFLGLLAALTIGPGLIHTLLPDGGAHAIAGLDLGDRREVIVGVFRWEGATQLALGLAMLAVSIRYQSLTGLFLLLVLLQNTLTALEGWVVSPPSNGHHPPEHYGALKIAPLTAIFLVLALRPRRTAASAGT